jgi:stress-induced morphogen
MAGEKIKADIAARLTEVFEPTHLEVTVDGDTSCGAKVNVVVISDKFEGLTRGACGCTCGGFTDAFC